MTMKVLSSLILAFPLYAGAMSREEVQVQHQINVEREVGYNLPVAKFPTRPKDAIAHVYKPFDGDVAELYIWRVDGDVYIDIVPVAGRNGKEAFICSPNFYVIQDRAFYGGVVFRTENGDSFCDDQKIKRTVKLDSWKFQDHQMDFSRDFILVAEPTFVSDDNKGLWVEM